MTLRESVLTKRATARKVTDTPQDVLYKAERARMLLDDDVLVTIFDEIEIAGLEEALRAADDETRRHALDRVNVVRDVRNALFSRVDAAEHKAREGVRVP